MSGALDPLVAAGLERVGPIAARLVDLLPGDVSVSFQWFPGLVVFVHQFDDWQAAERREVSFAVSFANLGEAQAGVVEWAAFIGRALRAPVGAA